MVTVTFPDEDEFKRGQLSLDYATRDELSQAFTPLVDR
jgi:hypothetical protein